VKYIKKLINNYILKGKIGILKWTQKRESSLYIVIDYCCYYLRDIVIVILLLFYCY